MLIDNELYTKCCFNSIAKQFNTFHKLKILFVVYDANHCNL